MQIKPWLLASRPKTLPAAMAPVFVGTALAYDAGGFDWIPALICLAFALLIQVATNFANDYFDFKKGADTVERIGPTRAVAAGLIKPETMKRMTAITFAIAFVIGLCLIPYGGWWLLAVGVASVLCGYAYTAGPYPLAYVGARGCICNGFLWGCSRFLYLLCSNGLHRFGGLARIDRDRWVEHESTGD